MQNLSNGTADSIRTQKADSQGTNRNRNNAWKTMSVIR